MWREGRLILLAAIAMSAVAGCGQPSSGGSPSNQPGSVPSGSTEFFSGHGADTETFTVQAGNYVIDAYAEYDPTYDTTGSGSCFFYGAFDDLSGGSHATLGSTDPVQASAPYSQSATGSLGAGTYRLTVEPITDCDWRFTLASAGN